MSGHSKWSTIKRKKGANDAKRGKIFSKLIKEITVAARQGGGDVDGNPRLRSAIAAAKAENMPKDNIARAVDKGSGGGDGDAYEEILYEGYGPGGVALMLEILTDNRNRTAADVRMVFDKYGGNLGENGCVAWMFDKKGQILVDKEKISEEELLEKALEAGAEDVIEDENEFQVLTSIDEFNDVRDSLEEQGVEYLEATVSMIPQNTIEVDDEKVAASLLKLLENLEDHDDVQKVHANFDIDQSLMEKLS